MEKQPFEDVSPIESRWFSIAILVVCGMKFTFSAARLWTQVGSDPDFEVWMWHVGVAQQELLVAPLVESQSQRFHLPHGSSWGGWVGTSN